jgi:hypothetical protein
MKTPMQQLKQIIGTDQKFIPTNFLLAKIELLILEEKDQLENAYLTGRGFGNNETLEEAEQFYNSFYNN